MKHYVLGLIYNDELSGILLIKKEKPEWMKGRWNGIGGKIEDKETPLQAMERESHEEMGHWFKFQHVITFVCPGGTVFVYKALSGASGIPYVQKEDEELAQYDLAVLPELFSQGHIMGNLKWIIPLSLSSVQFPVMIIQTKLGVEL